jgi:hypothetical protein
VLNWEIYSCDCKNLLLVPVFRPDESSSHRGSARSILMSTSQSVSIVSSDLFPLCVPSRMLQNRLHEPSQNGPGYRSRYIATHYGLGGSGIKSRRRRDFPHPSRPALGFTELPAPWVPGFSRGLRGRDVALTTHSHLASRLKKE